LTRDPIPESGHEQLLAKFYEREKYIYYLRLFILTLMVAFGQTLLTLKIYSVRTCTCTFAANSICMAVSKIL